MVYSITVRREACYSIYGNLISKNDCYWIVAELIVFSDDLLRSFKLWYSIQKIYEFNKLSYADVKGKEY